MGVRNAVTDAIATVTTYGSGGCPSAWARAAATGASRAVVAAGNELRHEGHDGVDRQQHQPRAPVADRVVEPSRQERRRSALFHRGTEGNGAGDEDEDARVDRAMGLAGRQTAGEDHGDGAGEPRD